MALRPQYIAAIAVPVVLVVSLLLAGIWWRRAKRAKKLARTPRQPREEDIVDETLERDLGAVALRNLRRDPERTSKDIVRDAVKGQFGPVHDDDDDGSKREASEIIAATGREWPRRYTSGSAPASQGMHGDALFVPKQRRTPASSTLANNINTLSHPRPTKTPCHTSDLHHPLRLSHKAVRSSARATTTGTLNTILSTPCANPRGISPRPARLVSSPPTRAFSAHLFTFKHDTFDSPQSLPSRLLSRVMAREPFSRKPRQRPISDAESSDVGDLRPETSSSPLDMVMRFDDDLDRALAAFPSPPKSTLTSPTTKSSFETSDITSSTARTLAQPRKVAIPCAQLNVFADTDRLSSDGGETVSVAIEIVGGVTPIDVAAADKPLPHIGLDVAVVVDNSLFASPGALMANCEAARFLASLLNNATDRMAVLCTKPIGANAKDPNVVSPLSQRSIRKIKSIVDTIVSSTTRPEPAALGMALERAIDLLTSPVSQQSDDEPGGKAYGHVFILTAHAGGVPSVLLNHELVEVHVIRPGALPWKDSAGSVCSGWMIAPLYSSSSQYMTLEKDRDKDSLFNRLRDLILHARTGSCCGKLTDLVLKVEAGHGCSIEAVMGQRNIASLRPGEVVTALIKVKVGPIFAEGYTLSPSRSLKVANSPMRPKDVFDELDVMLGASPTPIAVAKLAYKHSLLPAGTHCSTVGAAKLRRAIPHMPGEAAPMATIDQGEVDSRVLVQKRLVYQIATHHPPRQAITALQENFADGAEQILCPQYMKLITEELKYQARIVEPFDLPSPIKGNLSTMGDTLPYEHFGKGLFTIPSYKPQDWLTSVSDEESPRRSSSTLQTRSKPDTFSDGQPKAQTPRSRNRRPGTSMPSARQAGVPLSNRRAKGPASTTKRSFGIQQTIPSGGPKEETRTIWSDLRKLSKSKRTPGELERSASTNSPKVFRKGKWIRDLANRNKENVGRAASKEDTTGQDTADIIPLIGTQTGLSTT